MSRETYERSDTYWMQSELPRGKGDPDFYGYPNEELQEEICYDTDAIPF